MKNLVICLLSILTACSSRDPNINDFSGEWRNPSGAVIIIKRDGTFYGSRLPTKLLMFTDTSGIALTGNGRWELLKEQTRWILRINFDTTNISTYPDGFGSLFEISGHGILERRPPFYLYLWEGEEGASNRFSFKREGSPSDVDD
jgi:hypothetical protein